MSNSRCGGATTIWHGRRLLAQVAAVAAMIGHAPFATAQTSDTKPPTIVDFSFAPSTVDVTAGPQTVTVALHLTDDVSGLNIFGTTVVTFRSPTGVLLTVRPTRVSGSALDGVFVGNLVIPQFSASGVWTVTSVRVSDIAGNGSTVATDVLESRNLPSQLNVVSITDDQSPTVVGINVAPVAIDVSSNDQTVTLDLQLADALSGVGLSSCAPNPNPLSGLVATLRSPSGAQNRFTDAFSFTLVGGTRQNGTWRTAFTMPRYSEPGIWRVQSLTVLDCVGNQTNLSEAQLISAGLQISLNVASNPADTQAPVLTSLSFVPITINTSSGTQVVTVRMGISDNLSGADVTPTTPNATFFERGIRFTSPSGNQTRGAFFFSTFTLVSGTTLNGVWESTVTFPQFSEEGTWEASQVTIKDRTRNMTNFTTSDLRGLGFPTTLEVIKPSLVTDGTIDPARPSTITDQTFGDRASVFFPAGSVTVPTQVAIDVLSKPLDIPNPTGFTGPGTMYVNIHLTPQPTFPLSPPGLSIVLPIANAMIAGSQLKLYKVDPTTGGLIPAINVFGKPVVGFVDADGLSATFTGIASLSTVVGLIPEALNVGVDIKPGESPNTINLKSRGVLTAAILSTETFDAASVVPSSVSLAGAGVRVKPNGQPAFSLEDVNGDGRLDLVLQFDTQALSITSNDTEAVLTGRTKDGLTITGRDGIRIVP